MGKMTKLLHWLGTSFSAWSIIGVAHFFWMAGGKTCRLSRIGVVGKWKLGSGRLKESQVQG